MVYSGKDNFFNIVLLRRKAYAFDGNPLLFVLLGNSYYPRYHLLFSWKTLLRGSAVAIILFKVIIAVVVEVH